MVTVKERTIKGRKYVYVSTSATYKGETKRFEKSVGPKDSDPKELEQKIEFYSALLDLKRELYLTYLETKYVHFEHLPKDYAYPLVHIRRQYHKFLSDLYPSELGKYQEEFEIRYVHHTTAIEGNTLSLRDTALVLEKGISPSNKELREIHEVENYKKVLDFVKNYKNDVTLDFILKLHHLIQRGIDDNTAGNLRRIPIGIGGSKWEPPPAIAVKEELEDLLVWYNKNKKDLHPLELAGIFHHRFLQIHPFVDGNGRVAREVLNFILVRNGFPPLIIPVERREDYILNLESADEGNITPLLEFFIILLIEDYAKILKNFIEEFQGELSTEEQNEIENLVIWYHELIKEYIEKLPETLGDELKRMLVS